MMSLAFENIVKVEGWVWLKFKQEGFRRFWSIFPLTRVPFWNSVFLRHSHMEQSEFKIWFLRRPGIAIPCVKPKNVVDRSRPAPQNLCASRGRVLNSLARDEVFLLVVSQVPGLGVVLRCSGPAPALRTNNPQNKY